MKKKIYFRTTNEYAESHGFPGSRGDLALIPLEVELDTLTPAGRWIAEHITATYVIDEIAHVNGIKATARYSIADGYRKQGWPEDEVEKWIAGYGEYVTDPKYNTIPALSFPILGHRVPTPEAAIERVVDEIAKECAYLTDRKTGDRYDFS